MKWNKAEDKEPRKYQQVLVRFRDGTITGALFICDDNPFDCGFFPVRIKTVDCKNCDDPELLVAAEFDAQPELWAEIDEDWR